MAREQSFRDPVHDFITLSDPLFLDLIDTPEMQRLRRIRQLGASFGTYHGAEHSRFGHSLGVLWVMTKILDRFRTIGVPVDPEVATIARAAALLHDVGHGPFSHALEGKMTPGTHHEDWTLRVLLEPGPVHDRLARHSRLLPEQVARVIEGKFDDPPWVSDLVSSQMDVDRMDYLIRDSVYTGVTYGHFDLPRLINTLQVDRSGRVVSSAKGVSAIEEYLLARYFMYWQVYLHKTTRSHELTLWGMWRRAAWLWAEGRLTAADVPPPLVPILRGAPTLSEYLAVDDSDVIVAAKMWRTARDGILADLAARVIDRRLLKSVFKVAHQSIPRDLLPLAAEVVRSHGFDPDYYLLVDDVAGVAYDLYTPDAEEHKKPILALDEAGRPQEITRLSATMRALAAGPRVAVNIFAPQEAISDLRRIFGAEDQESGSPAPSPSPPL